MPHEGKYVLSRFEQILLTVAIVTVIVSIALALCISLVLPYHWTMDDYVKNKIKMAEYIAKCQCDRKKYTTNYIDCIPQFAFSERFLPIETQSTEKLETGCELIQNYPYLVSLNIPKYHDAMKEKQFACTGTILSVMWVLVGNDCIYHEDELKVLKVRAGSTYWSKGGTEHGLTTSSEFSPDGPRALRVNPPFTFNKFVSAVTVPTNGVYAKWKSAVSAGWNKNRLKFDKFTVRRWSTSPCPDGNCQKGEISTDISCGKKFESALVADGRILIGLQSGVCSNEQVAFVDLQSEDYVSWFAFLLDDKESIRHNTSALPLNIYEVTECIVLDPNYVQSTLGGDSVGSIKTTLETTLTSTVLTTERITTEVITTDRSTKKSSSNTPEKTSPTTTITKPSSLTKTTNWRIFPRLRYIPSDEEDTKITSSFDVTHNNKFENDDEYGEDERAYTSLDKNLPIPLKTTIVA